MLYLVLYDNTYTICLMLRKRNLIFSFGGRWKFNVVIDYCDGNLEQKTKFGDGGERIRENMKTNFAREKKPIEIVDEHGLVYRVGTN